MSTFQRREELRQMLLKEKSITVLAAAEKFEVSDETIRRDLTFLSNEGFCNKIYGGAYLASRSASGVSSKTKKEIFVEEKRKMAKIAAQLLRPNDCVFLDHSTTVSELCSEIRALSLTVVTNSMWVLNELSDLNNIKLVATGGNLHTADQGMFGQETLIFLKNHYVDKAFFSCRGLHETKGFFDSSEYIAQFHQSLIENSNKSFLMADHTKFSKVGFVNVMKYSDLDAIITNTKPSENWMEVFSQNNVRVYHSLNEG